MTDPQPPDPEDVAPLGPWDHSPYRKFVRRVLLGDDLEPWAFMICMPSFRDEYAVALTPPEPVEAPDGTVSYFEGMWTLLVASARIDAAFKYPTDWSALDPRSIQCNRQQVAIDAAVAEEIASAWKLVVQRARNPRPVYWYDDDGARWEVGSTRLDGVGYAFQAGHYSGTSDSPGPGPASDLVDLLDRLRVAAVTQSTTVRQSVLEQSVARARTLRERAEGLPW